MENIKLSVGDISVLLESRIARGRRLKRIVESKKFEEVWISADEEQQQKILNLIEAEEDQGLKKLLYTHTEEALGELNIQDLRKKASGLGIYNYSRLPASQLIAEIHAYEIDKKQDD